MFPPGTRILEGKRTAFCSLREQEPEQLRATGAVRSLREQEPEQLRKPPKPSVMLSSCRDDVDS